MTAVQDRRGSGCVARGACRNAAGAGRGCRLDRDHGGRPRDPAPQSRRYHAGLPRSCARRSPTVAIRSSLSSPSPSMRRGHAVAHRDHGVALWSAAAATLSMSGMLCVLDRHRLGRWYDRRAVCRHPWHIARRHGRAPSGISQSLQGDSLSSLRLMEFTYLASCRGSRRSRC